MQGLLAVRLVRLGLVLVGILSAGLGTSKAQETTAKPPIATPNPNAVDYWQPLWMQRELWGAGNMPKSMQARVLRHWTFTQYGIPKEYLAATAPTTNPIESVNVGARTYMRHCASCHGRTGLGDGVAAHSLLPSPALLAYMVQRPISVDSYLLWSISEGGVAFGTDMPAFKKALTRQEIWDLIAFMRAGFPERASTSKQEGK